MAISQTPPLPPRYHEERLYNSLLIESSSLGESQLRNALLKQVPNLHQQNETMHPKIKMLYDLGLVGCISDPEINSANYRDFLFLDSPRA